MKAVDFTAWDGSKRNLGAKEISQPLLPQDLHAKFLKPFDACVGTHSMVSSYIKQAILGSIHQAISNSISCTHLSIFLPLT